MAKNRMIFMSFLDWLDIELYRFFRRLKKLSKRQRRVLLGMVALLGLLLVGTISTHSKKNSAWLEGNWSSKSEDYAIQSRNGECWYWTIKQDSRLLMRDAQIAVNSSKNRIVLTQNGKDTEYHVRRLDGEHSELEVFINHKKAKTLALHRVK